MLLPSDTMVRIIIFILGLCGFFVARHIHNHKAKKMPLICPIGFDCNAVVHSDYSEFIGMKVEIAGMIYYAFISAAYLLLILRPSAMPTSMAVLPVIIAFVAFLFSVYLSAVQMFILKKGCSWCIASAVISALIFIFLII